jgi:hypothetical protein
MQGGHQIIHLLRRTADSQKAVLGSAATVVVIDSSQITKAVIWNDAGLWQTDFAFFAFYISAVPMFSGLREETSY